MAPGKYYVTVKYNGKNVAGSPYACFVDGENLTGDDAQTGTGIIMYLSLNLVLYLNVTLFLFFRQRPSPEVVAVLHDDGDPEADLVHPPPGKNATNVVLKSYQ